MSSPFFLIAALAVAIVSCVPDFDREIVEVLKERSEAERLSPTHVSQLASDRFDSKERNRVSDIVEYFQVKSAYEAERLYGQHSAEVQKQVEAYKGLFDFVKIAAISEAEQT